MAAGFIRAFDRLFNIIFFKLAGSLLLWRAVNVIVASFLTQGRWTGTPLRRLRRSQDPDQRPSPLIEYRSVRVVLLCSYKRLVAAEDFLSALFEATDLDGPAELPQAGMTSTSGEGGGAESGTNQCPSEFPSLELVVPFWKCSIPSTRPTWRGLS